MPEIEKKKFWSFFFVVDEHSPNIIMHERAAYHSRSEFDKQLLATINRFTFFFALFGCSVTMFP